MLFVLVSANFPFKEESFFVFEVVDLLIAINEFLKVIEIPWFSPKYFSASSTPFLYDWMLWSNFFKNSYSAPILWYAIANTANLSAFNLISSSFNGIV